MIRSALLAAVSTVVLGSIAMAADLPSEKGPPVYAPPPPPVFSWTGFYVGGQVGYGWGHTSSSTTFTAGIPGALPVGSTIVNPGSDSSGIVGGGHIGYNYQISQFVFGLEADANGSSEGSSTLLPSGYTGFGHKEFDASIRARAGVAFDRVLIYATGGGAYGDVRLGLTDPAGLSEVHYADHFGWTVGGGVEYAIDNNWSLRAEYRYTDYGPFDITYTTFPSSPFTVHYHGSDNRVQVGFSYLFNPPPPPPPVVAKY